MKIRFGWHFNSDPEMHFTDLEVSPQLTGEAVIKEQIGIAEGDRCLAQYIVITEMRKADS